MEWISKLEIHFSLYNFELKIFRWICDIVLVIHAVISANTACIKSTKSNDTNNTH